MFKKFGIVVTSALIVCLLPGSAPVAVAAYTTGSVQFGSSGQYLSVPNGGDFAVGTGDFTVEYWQYMTSAPAGAPNTWPRVWWVNSVTPFGVSIESYLADAPMFYLWVGGAIAVGSLNSFSTNYQNRWKHIAISRSGTSLRVFIDGTQLGSTAVSSFNISDASTILAIGNHAGDSSRCAFPGRITNFHFVKGTALYTSNFTAPTSPTISTANSKLLIRATNSAGLLTDSSSVAKTISNVGSATFSSTSPSWVDPDTTAPTITGPSSATGATSSISIAENSNAVHTFTASESVTWSKGGTDGSFFTLSSGGVLTITSRNFEAPQDDGANNTYIVTITATDAATIATTQTLTVTITNVNEAPTITTASSNPSHSITQAENISSVTTYTGSDVDAGASLAWSISGTDAADFAIDTSSGVLTFAANPDFESPADSDANNTYIIIVTLSDGSLTDTQTVTITITNANESATINAPTVSGTIFKGVNTTITVTINVAGKVRFFVGNKRISTCKERTTSGSYPNNTATCTWKPAVTGRQFLTATLTPTDNTFSASTSARTEVFVVRRGTTR